MVGGVLGALGALWLVAAAGPAGLAVTLIVGLLAVAYGGGRGR